MKSSRRPVSWSHTETSSTPLSSSMWRSNCCRHWGLRVFGTVCTQTPRCIMGNTLLIRINDIPGPGASEVGGRRSEVGGRGPHLAPVLLGPEPELDDLLSSIV
ncbi:hypothetical protein EYF80_040561 [Liparis tanakae]|uniref:Uncharacterized protein n=1 Tax=Liparis tanakae TaxID=230148 RepID=A0A4Z2G7R2_9TELE|nr:hypothetical protein EYF80_040561 [Liparis tanakae]